jgi:c-di-GMP-binding flagellar brake protein YcgR
MAEEIAELEAQQEEFELEPISRSVTLRLRVGLKYETVESEIIEIQEDGKVVLISPMSGSRPRPVRAGSKIQIFQEIVGGKDLETEVTAVEQTFNAELEQWTVVTEQVGFETEWIIRSREFVRERCNFPVQLAFRDQAEDGPFYDCKTEDLSGSGMRVLVELEDRSLFSVGEELAIILDIPDILGDSGEQIVEGHLLPAFPGTIVRRFVLDTRGGAGVQCILGIGFDTWSEEDEDIGDYLLRYVLKLQIRNQALQQD